MAIRFLDTILSGSLAISGSYTLPIIDTGSTGVIGQMGINGEIPHFYSSQGWQAVSGSKFTPIPPPSANIEYVVVAGGGGGGDGYYGGGGGAGGYLSGSLSSIESGSLFTIVVGTGGAGATGQSADGANGTTSSIAGASITTIAAIGGGGGASRSSDPGADGGSGGGAALETSYGGGAGSGTAGQGNDGGVGGGYGAGGGGASQAGFGESGTGNNDGGSGSASTITGTSIFRAGGGGGGGWSTSYSVGSGAPGGGGDGGDGRLGTSPTAGTNNTGGGGGGGGGNGNDGAAGGSGVVILAYPTASISATGGVRTFFNNRVAHTFNATGTFTVDGTKTYTHNTLDVFGDSSCLALYQLDGNANDKSGNYNGTASNVTYSQGYINNGGVFNGSSSYISVDGSILNSLTAASYTAWVYYKGTGSGQSYGHIVSGGATNSTASGKAFGMAVRNSDDLLYIWASNSETSFTSTALPENVWTHLAVTNSGGTAKMYMNGSLIHTSNPTSLAFNSSSNNLRIGEYFYNGSHHFYGEIDQVRIFNKVLSASEVLTLYNE